ncbi:MAG: prolyl aminopeptidase, partial [Rhodospirillaceae bacterium]
PAARAWSAYEEACSRLVPRPSLGPGVGPDNLAMARLEAHYMMHGGFLDEAQLLARIDRVRGLPCTIVQGRYDIVCPPESAYALHQAWPGSILHIVPDAGHSALEPGTRTALLAAMRKALATHGK